jgi:hypothetical protein
MYFIMLYDNTILLTLYDDAMHNVMFCTRENNWCDTTVFDVATVCLFMSLHVLIPTDAHAVIELDDLSFRSTTQWRPPSFLGGAAAVCLAKEAIAKRERRHALTRGTLLRPRISKK